MTACVVTTRAGTEDGEPCLQRGAHSGDCPGDACEGCAPTPVAPGRLVCTRHEDAVREALQALPDLYSALGEPTSQNAGTTDMDDATSDAVPQLLPPVVAARMLIKSRLVDWCKVLEDDLDVRLPDERNIAADTRYAIITRQWDVDLAVKAQRAAASLGERAHLAKVAEAHRRAAGILRDERAAGVDVIRALAGHVDDHRPKLLREYRAWLPLTDEENTRRAFLAPERARIFAEDILDVHARARGLAYPRRTALRIRCSCGARVAVDTDPERYYTCPGCGEYGTLDWWKRREAPPMTFEPMPLAELPEWLLRHHRLPVTLEALRGWARGERAAISATELAGRDERGRRTPALYDPVAVLAVARKRAEKGRRSA